ncbi:MAG TPA: 3-deoxy-8-phosphooctulonate synthase [Burkholderiales bacterium]
MQLCGFDIGPERPFFLIAGPCVIESHGMVIETARELRRITSELGIPFIFKASFDKANRTAGTAFRGPGMRGGLTILAGVKAEGIPVLTDVHEAAQVADVAAVADVLQTPAFLCRQTDFIEAVVRAGKPVNIKKGQFLAPADMRHVVAKAHAAGGEGRVMVCERGASFGYGNLVADMRSLAILRAFAPVVFDATHSVQLPGGKDGASGGQREFVPVLARAAIAVGVSGLFMETHPNPDRALSDGPNSWPLAQMRALLEELQRIDACVKIH